MKGDGAGGGPQVQILLCPGPPSHPHRPPFWKFLDFLWNFVLGNFGSIIFAGKVPSIVILSPTSSYPTSEFSVNVAFRRIFFSPNNI